MLFANGFLFDHNSDNIHTNSRGVKPANPRNQHSPKKANNKKFHTPELCVAMCESNVSVEQITWTFGMNTLNCVWREIWSSTGCVYACNWEPIWYHNYDHWISIFINYTYPLATTGRSVFILHFVLLFEWKTCKRNWSKQHI